jgi:hypothetical protein
MELRVEDSNHDGFIDWNYGVGELLGLHMSVHEIGNSAHPIYTSQVPQTIKDLHFDLSQQRFTGFLALDTDMSLYTLTDPLAPFLQLGGGFGPIYQLDFAHPQVSAITPSVPEPSALHLLALAVAALLWQRRRQR